MNIGQITAWFQLIILILQYGKKVVDLAIEIYERFEEKFRGAKDEGAKKAAGFERVFVSEVKASKKITGVTEMKALGNVEKIREGVWKTRPENLRRRPKTIFKVPLGTKPGSGGVY